MLANQLDDKYESSGDDLNPNAQGIACGNYSSRHICSTSHGSPDQSGMISGCLTWKRKSTWAKCWARGFSVNLKLPRGELVEHNLNDRIHNSRIRIQKFHIFFRKYDYSEDIITWNFEYTNVTNWMFQHPLHTIFCNIIPIPDFSVIFKKCQF